MRRSCCSQFRAYDCARAAIRILLSEAIDLNNNIQQTKGSNALVAQKARRIIIIISMCYLCDIYVLPMCYLCASYVLRMCATYV